jgi:hypothetical protein
MVIEAADIRHAVEGTRALGETVQALVEKADLADVKAQVADKVDKAKAQAHDALHSAALQKATLPAKAVAKKVVPKKAVRKKGRRGPVLAVLAVLVGAVLVAVLIQKAKREHGDKGIPSVATNE